MPEATYALGAVCRITGLSPHVLRVWESRYAAVVPQRTPGGTRRYHPADVERLQLLRRAVEAGHRIGTVVGLADAELAALARRDGERPPPAAALDRALAAISALDMVAAERVLADQLLALGPVRFAREFVIPLLSAVGREWSAGALCIAAEHMASSLLRSLLGAALRPPARPNGAPTILFSTLTGERHELGLLVSAVVAMGEGANPIFLGAELPPDELSTAACRTEAAAVVLAVTKPGRQTRRELARVRSGLPASVEVWLGGAGAENVELPTDVVVLSGFDDLERHARRLCEPRAVRLLERAPRSRRRGAAGRSSRRRPN